MKTEIITILVIGGMVYALQKRNNVFGLAPHDNLDEWFDAGSSDWDQVIKNAGGGGDDSLADWFAGATNAVVSSGGLGLPEKQGIINTLAGTMNSLGFDEVPIIPSLLNTVKSVFSDDVQSLLDRISLGEGTSDAAARIQGYQSGYDVTLGYGLYVDDKSRRLSEMTLQEVRSLQSQMLINPKNKWNSSAAGRYQFTRTNLFGNATNGWHGLRNIAGLSYTDKFSKQVQENFARILLERRGFSSYKAGAISAKEFQYKLAHEWASIANPYTGETLIKGQHLGTVTADILPLIEKLKVS